MSEVQEKPRDQKAVFRARRELLLDAIAEGCTSAIDYADAAQLFVFERDRAALFPAINGLVEKAISVGEAARDLRQLLASQNTGGTQ
ncbi:MAG: hypothetical protein ACLPSF_00825 [Methylocella sp.]